MKATAESRSRNLDGSGLGLPKASGDLRGRTIFIELGTLDQRVDGGGAADSA